jgi:hypothetical protein
LSGQLLHHGNGRFFSGERPDQADSPKLRAENGGQTRVAEPQSVKTIADHGLTKGLMSGQL